MSENIKQGDHFILQRTLRYGDGSPIDLSSVDSVVFYAVKDGDSTVTITGECVLVDEVNGVVSYSFDGTDTDTVGMYRAYWIIKSVGDDQMTVPSEGRYWVHIEESDYFESL